VNNCYICIVEIPCRVKVGSSGVQHYFLPSGDVPLRVRRLLFGVGHD